MKVDPSMPAAPAFRPIRLSDAAAYSPWPMRLAGFEAWQRPRRSKQEVLREYDQGWYLSLLESWREFVARHDPPRSNSATVSRFYHQVWCRIADEVERNRAIYKSRQAEYLVSSGDDFLIADLVTASHVHLDVITRQVERVLQQVGANTLVEAGSGSGVVLHHLYATLPLRRVGGGDICPNAVELCRQIAGDYRIPAQFCAFDYDSPTGFKDLTHGFEDYVLLTCHSVEQIEAGPTRLFEKILDLPRPPAAVVHLEPLVWPDGSLVSKLGQRYAELNGYNLDFLEALNAQLEQGTIEVLALEKRLFGVSAFNPTSLIAWRPR